MLEDACVCQSWRENTNPQSCRIICSCFDCRTEAAFGNFTFYTYIIYIYYIYITLWLYNLKDLLCTRILMLEIQWQHLITSFPNYFLGTFLERNAYDYRGNREHITWIRKYNNLNNQSVGFRLSIILPCNRERNYRQKQHCLSLFDWFYQFNFTNASL